MASTSYPFIIHFPSLEPYEPYEFSEFRPYLYAKGLRAYCACAYEPLRDDLSSTKVKCVASTSYPFLIHFTSLEPYDHLVFKIKLQGLLILTNCTVVDILFPYIG